MDLYNHIYENTKHNIMELNDEEKQTIIDLIPKLDQKGHDLLYFLIRMYHNQELQDITFTLPYQTSPSESDGKNIEFNLSNFPCHLQHIVFLFTKMHYNYINETNYNYTLK
jgi:hypothetical protein